MLDLYRAAAESGRDSGPPVTQPVQRDFVEEVGHATAVHLRDAKRVFAFSGELVIGVIGAVRRPRSVHWREVGPLMERAGVDAVPIVTLINFLVGLIMGYQAAIQLVRFGANIFIANLVGLSITRELGPLMTAIIVAGRSGAAYAAELGTMRVRDEIDALSTLSLDPARFLVLPRIVALAFVVPILTLLADLVGCAGGLLVAIAQLDLTMTSYLGQLQEAVDPWDVVGGLIKSIVFAVTIVLISCQRGLATRGGADAVGRSTTSAVVIILFALVTLDAIFAVVYDTLGI
jgi:phospholipid/cholesterol/gamma-HCH transport system permease protein